MHYVMSDIHGHRSRFDSIMEQIELKPNDKLFVLGDVIDRNPDGLQILLELKKMPNVRMLLGNHEHMMLDVLEHPGDGTKLRRWYRNGGDITHAKFEKMPSYLQDEIVSYLNKMEINIDLKVGSQEYLLVHGAPMEYVHIWPYDFEDPTTYAVWTRLEPYMKLKDGRVMIFGHTPTCNYQRGKPMKVWFGEDMIGIDCGAAYDYRGRLACLRLEDMEVFYSDH